MKRVIIIGARADGHAKVVASILLQMKKYQLVGFIDDDLKKKGMKILGKPVLGKVGDVAAIIRKHRVKGGIVAIGENPKRRELSDLLLKHRLELINAIHPTAHYDPDVIIGKGNYIGQGVMIVTGTRIGNAVNIHTSASIDHDNVIEDGANLGPGVHTAGRVRIGKDATLGTGVLAIPDVEIGSGAIVGAGSVVIAAVRPGSKVVGAPAREV